ncbi:MAG: oligosaccharide flippase family protein [bacterium]|nr:oligosaccharide flippase family protein [bacterium]
MSSLIGAARWASVATLFRAMLQFMQLIVLARCLGPEDMGVAVLTFSLIAMMQVFSDIGLNNIILHRRDLSSEELASLYGVGLVFGFILFLISVPLSYGVARFYADERLVAIVLGVGGIFLLNAVWSQPKVIAERDFLFFPVALCEMAAGGLSFIFLIVISFYYRTPFAVVLCALSYSLFMGVGVFLIGRLRPRYGVRLSFEKIRPFLMYSSFNFGFSVVNSITSQIDVFIGARVIGAAQMGGYGVAKDLGLKIALVINNTATRVSSPFLSKSQSDPIELKNVYSQILGFITFLNFPIYVSMIFSSEDWIRLLFGNKWSSSSQIFVIFALWGMVRSVGHPSGALLFVTGESRKAFIFAVFTALAFIPILYIGATYGVVELAASLLLVLVGQQVFPVWYYLVRPHTAMSFLEYWRLPMKAFLCSTLAFGAAHFIYVLSEPSLLLFFLTQMSAALLYLLISFKFNKRQCEVFLKAIGLRSLLLKP